MHVPIRIHANPIAGNNICALYHVNIKIMRLIIPIIIDIIILFFCCSDKDVDVTVGVRVGVGVGVLQVLGLAICAALNPSGIEIVAKAIL